jgi:hypothetical protein
MCGFLNFICGELEYAKPKAKCFHKKIDGKDFLPFCRMSLQPSDLVLCCAENF